MPAGCRAGCEGVTSAPLHPEGKAGTTSCSQGWRVWVCLAFAMLLAGVARAAEPGTVLHLLDYIAVDYAGAVENGKVTDADEYKEMHEFTGQARTMIDGLPENATQPALRAGAAEIARLVDARAPAADVAAKANALRREVARAYQVQMAPRQAPDLVRGERLYADACAACHGAAGRGDGFAGKTLEPPPSNFRDLGRMAQRSVHGLYNTVTLGVAGTAMLPFQLLSEDDRWALAFFVANFAADEAMRARGESLWHAGKRRADFPDLGNVTTLTMQEASKRFGDDGVAVLAYLRAHPQALNAGKPSPIEFAITALGQSLHAYRRGAQAEAIQLAIQAYLEGFELAEAGLRNVDAELLTQTEREMMAYRGLVQTGAPIEEVQRQEAAVQALLRQVSERLAGAQMSPATTFLASLVILLREGAEAILVVAAILAFLSRAGRTDARRWVHAGWLAALGVGTLTWLVSRHVLEISGADRELTEGVTALIAAVMLLYVGYWLHSKSHSRAWQKFIGDRVGGALSSGTVWTLSLVSFLAVYREAFETVLFYQALSAQAGAQGQGSMLAGAGVAAALLVGIAWVIVRASIKLPIGLFFSASGLVLLALAVVFTGQGIAALQEAGTIGADPLGSLRLPVLGIYPTLQTLAAQAVVTVAGAWVVFRASRSQLA